MALKPSPRGGDYAWDNNLIERVNRYISLSRKNSLFFGSHAGAERGAILTPWPVPAYAPDKVPLKPRESGVNFAS